MAIKRTDLDSDLKSFYDENGALVQVTKTDLDNALFVNQDTALAAGETAERVKKFFDFMPLHVFLPWVNAVVEVLNDKAVEIKNNAVEIKNNKASCDSNLQTAVQALNKAIAEVRSKADDAFDQANLADSSLSGFKNGAYEDDKAALKAKIEAVQKELHALADSDDTTLDQLSEIVAYIKANKGLIDAVTTAKVSVESIVDNLNTSDAKKVLSAAQGVALKKMVDDVNKRFDENPPEDGEDGLSAYEIALENGFEGSEEEWLASLKGADGNSSAATFYVTVTNTDGVLSADKTPEEIETAYQNGAAVFCVCIDENEVSAPILHLRSLDEVEDIKVIQFSECFEDGVNKVVCSQQYGMEAQWRTSFTKFAHDKLKNLDNPDQHPIEAIKGLQVALDGKADKPSDITEVIVDNSDGEDSSLQVFVYTLPSDDTVITVDGWGLSEGFCVDPVIEGGNLVSYSDYYELSSKSSITLPECLSEDARAKWKAGTTIGVRYGSDIITSAVARYSDNHATESYVNAKIEELKKLLGY